MTNLADKIIRLRDRLGTLHRDAGWHLGFGRNRVRQAKGTRILVYHGLCREHPFRFNTLFLTMRSFENQLKLYKEYFNIISLDDLYQQRIHEDRFSLCLTFDDGFANNYEYVLPLLEKYQVPATFFITAIRDTGYDILWNDVLSVAYRHGPSKFHFRDEQYVRGKDGKYISTGGQLLVDRLRGMDFDAKAEMIGLLGSFKKEANPDYWLQMSIEQIKTLSLNKWATIGSHAYYHNDLAKIPVSSMKRELERSKQFLENITGKEIKALAFPYGSFSGEVVREAKAVGFTQLLAAGYPYPGDKMDQSLKERLIINPFITGVNQMYANITGSYK